MLAGWTLWGRSRVDTTARDAMHFDIGFPLDVEPLAIGTSAFAFALSSLGWWPLLTLLSFGTINASPQSGAPAASVPRYQGLGGFSRKVTTPSPEAQAYFDQGLSFLYAFNHDEAVRAFRRAAELDPDCAMAHWGISLSMGKNYNYPLFPPEKANSSWWRMTNWPCVKSQG